MEKKTKEFILDLDESINSNLGNDLGNDNRVYTVKKKKGKKDKRP